MTTTKTKDRPMALAPLLAVLLVVAPPALAGGFTPTGSGNQVCLPETVRDQCVNVKTPEVKEPRCIGAACDNPCLQKARTTTTDSTTINSVCGIPVDSDPCDGEKCWADCFDGGGSEGDPEVCGRPIPQPNTERIEECANSPLNCPGGGDDEESESCVGVPGTVYCCLNTEGETVPFELQGQVAGVNYNVIILKELFANGDNQKDIRVGWNNQVPESRKAVTWELTSSRNLAWVDFPDGDPHTGWYVPAVTTVVSQAVGQLECGLILYATNGGGVDPSPSYGGDGFLPSAIVQVKGWFSGLDYNEGKATTVGVTSSVSVESSSTTTRTWENEISVSYSATGGTSGGSRTWGGSESETHSYGVGRTTMLEEGASVTFHPTEWHFDSAPFEVS